MSRITVHTGKSTKSAGGGHRHGRASRPCEHATTDNNKSTPQRWASPYTHGAVQQTHASRKARRKLGLCRTV